MRKITFHLSILAFLGLSGSATAQAVIDQATGTGSAITWDSHADSVKVGKVKPSQLPEPECAGVRINGVCWAIYNVDRPGFFAANPEDAGMFYQWGRNVGWSSADPMTNSNGGTTWDSAVPTGTEWETANDPCPEGWRVPTLEEIESLLETAYVTREWTTENGISGYRFTDIATDNTLFLPAAGYRSNNGGMLGNVDSHGYYWNRTLSTTGAPYILNFLSSDIDIVNAVRTAGYSVRCVDEKKKISGTVMRQNSTPLDKGSVSLYKVKTTGYYILIETVPIENDGTYLFTQVEDGNYIVRAEPDKSENALPTYYGDTEVWEKASIVTIANGNSVDGIDIRVIPYGTIMDGTSVIMGLVVEKDRRGVVGGVDVYIQTSEQGDTYQTTGGTTTDSITGAFVFANLPGGNYRVILDMPGVVIDHQDVNDLPEGDTSHIVFEIPPLSINSPAKEEMIKVYPNPTTGELTITNYELRITNVEVFDVYGRKQLSTLNSQFSTQIDISHLPTGMYFLRIQTDKGVVTKKIIKK